MADIAVARAAGARLNLACELAGIDERTFQRWKAGEGLQRGDGRPLAERPTPAHALTESERTEILARVNEPRYADLPPARIVPALADEGRYIASESSFYRVLREAKQLRHRGRAQAPTAAAKPPTTHVATGPRQVWCWGMTYLPTHVIGQGFFLYLILDLYSRKIVGFTVEVTDNSDHATHLVKRTALAEGIHRLATKPVLHGDNGSTLKATRVLAMRYWLGVKPSYSRPRVSNDNAYSESLFRTAKVRPEFPARGFATIDDARLWTREFVRWYRNRTPAQWSPPRHPGAASCGRRPSALLASRHTLYQAARQHPPGAGAERPATGRPLAPSRSTPNSRLSSVSAQTRNPKGLTRLAGSCQSFVQEARYHSPSSG